MSKIDIKKIEEQLKKEEREIQEELKVSKDYTDMGHDAGDVEEVQEEAEGMATNLGMKATMKERLEEIENALNKIRAGKYGICEKCGKKIGDNLLSVDPESRYCQKCKSSYL